MGWWGGRRETRGRDIGASDMWVRTSPDSQPSPPIAGECSKGAFPWFTQPPGPNLLEILNRRIMRNKLSFLQAAKFWVALRHSNGYWNNIRFQWQSSHFSDSLNYIGFHWGLTDRQGINIQPKHFASGEGLQSSLRTYNLCVYAQFEHVCSSRIRVKTSIKSCNLGWI